MAPDSMTDWMGILGWGVVVERRAVDLVSETRGDFDRAVTNAVPEVARRMSLID